MASCRLFWFSIVPLIAIVAVGCGRPPSGNVTGTVTLKSKPVVEGTVMFQSTQHACTAKIKDGKFELRYQGTNEIPIGNYRVAVLPPLPKRPEFTPNQAPADGLQDSGESIAIEKKYQSIETSGIDVEVVEGVNEIPLDLD